MSRKKNIIIIYVFLLIFLYLIIYVLPNIIGSLKSSYAVQYGEIEVSQNANGLIVRDENIYTAASSGKSNYLISDDDLVRVGTKIVDIEGGKKEADEDLLKLSKKVKAVTVPTGDYTAQYDGLVAYCCDGYESKFRPENIDKVSETTIKSLDDLPSTPAMPTLIPLPSVYSILGLFFKKHTNFHFDLFTILKTGSFAAIFLRFSLTAGKSSRLLIVVSETLSMYILWICQDMGFLAV